MINSSLTLYLVTTLDQVMENGSAVLCPPANSLYLRVNLPSIFISKIMCVPTCLNPGLTYPYIICMRKYLGVVILNMCGISLLGLVWQKKCCPKLLPSTYLLIFLCLFLTYSPTVPVLPSGAFNLQFMPIPF